MIMGEAMLAVRLTSPRPRCLRSAAFMLARNAASVGCRSWAIASASPSVYLLTTTTGFAAGAGIGAGPGFGRLGGCANAPAATASQRPPASSGRDGRGASTDIIVLDEV